MDKTKVITLKKKPKEFLEMDCFSIEERPIRELLEGEVLLKTIYLSIDAANRAWIAGPTYRSEVLVGDIMPAYGVAEVIESKDINFKKGDLASGEINWAEYTINFGNLLTKEKPIKNPADLFTYRGVAGLTAFHGLINVAKIKPKDTVLVSSAAGSVGMFACQIAKLTGCNVIGLSSSEEKCAWVRKNLGIDTCIDYTKGDLVRVLKKQCPEGIDVYFDNVGGSLLENVLYNMKIHGRVACCGAVSQYDTSSIYGPKNIPGILVTKRLKLQGFLVLDFTSENQEALEILSKWSSCGHLKVFTDEYIGLEKAPIALINLLSGKNMGKTLVKL